MEIKQLIRSQYIASLGMLREVLVKCPAESWNAPGDKECTWEKVYHALRIAHMYLQPTLDDFVPWAAHREGKDAKAYTQAEMLDYLAIVEAEVNKRLLEVDLNAPSGFHWLPINKLELQVYNIRHIQQHVGELYERLDRHNIDLDWVGIAQTQK